MQSKLKPGHLQRVQAAVEVRGELKLNADGTQVRRLPLLVNGDVSYEERLLELSGRKSAWEARSVRYYDKAKADIKVGTGLSTPSLNSDRHIVVAEVRVEGARFHSPLGPLTRDELDLVDVQGNSLLLACLLPTKPVRLGEKWQIDQGPLATLVGLDVVTQSDAACSFEKIDGDLAILDVRGTVYGAVGGVSSTIIVLAKCNYHLRHRQVTWFAANLQEDRAIGHAEPGLQVTARLRVAVVPISESERLNDKALRDLPIDDNPGAELVALEVPKCSFRFVHDRRWRCMLERHDLCVLRFVDRGDLVAQCNISPLNDLEPGKQLALEAFQAQVQESLGKNFGQIVEASQSETNDGKRVLRVQASGTVSEIAINWIYYHVSDNQGRRAALAFTMDADLMERFAENDRLLVDSLEFTPRQPPSEAKRTAADHPKRS
jgi:hypothetical protein